MDEIDNQISNLYLPKITVIMGSYNSSDKINDAISSIINQTFTDWELIICDDCSKIAVENIIDDGILKDKRIKIIHNQENQGLAESLNNCLKLAKGKYIARMDDDDYSYENRFQVQYDFLESNRHISFVSSDIHTYDGVKIIKTSNQIESPKKKDFLYRSPFVHPATMFRKEALLKVNGYRVAKETKRAEDYDLFMRLYAEGYLGYNIKENLFRYFVNPSAMKNKRKYKYRLDEAKVRYLGFKRLKLLNPISFIFVLKPILVGLIPHRLLWVIKNKKLKKGGG